MAFVNSVSQSLPGFGSPSNDGYATQALTATATITIAATTTTPSTAGVPFNTNGGPAPSRGKIHVRTSAVNAATITAFIVTVTDGTATLLIDQFGPTTVGQGIDYTQELNTDLSITSISVVFTLSGTTTTATAEVEVSLT